MLKTLFMAVSLGAIFSFHLPAHAQDSTPKTKAELRALKGKGSKAIFKNSPLPEQEQKHNPQIERAIGALKKKAEIGWGVQWNDDQTGIETLEGEIPWSKSSKMTDRSEKIATDFLKENHELFQMRSDLADLRVERSIDATGGSIIDLVQTFNGLPVFNGHVKISIVKTNKHQLIDLVHNYYVPNINIFTTPNLSESDVITIAKNDVLQNYMYTVDITGQHAYSGEVIYDKEPPRVKLGILNLKGMPVLIYKLDLFVSRPHKSLRYMINANTGEITESGDTIMRAFGNGQVFNPNPVNTLNNTGLQGLSTSKGVDVPSSAYSTVKLNGITHTPRLGYSLKGPYVDVTDSIEAPYNFSASSGYALSSKRNFIFNRTNDVFEHVMVYYHIDTNQRYIQTLGLGSSSFKVI